MVPPDYAARPRTAECHPAFASVRREDPPSEGISRAAPSVTPSLSDYQRAGSSEQMAESSALRITKIPCQRTPLAPRNSSTMRLPHRNRKRMKLVEQPCLLAFRITGKGLPTKFSQRVI